MNEEKRCSNCAHPNMDRGYLGCAPMDFVPLTPFSTCIKWVAEHPVDTVEEEIPAELLGITEDTNAIQHVPDMGIVEETEPLNEQIQTDRSVLDMLLSDTVEEEPVVEAECAPKHTMNTIGDCLPDEATGALDAIAKVIPRLPDMIDEVAAMEPEEKEAFIADIKADMRADQEVYMESIDIIQFALKEIKRIYDIRPELLPGILGIEPAALRIVEDFAKTLPSYQSALTDEEIDSSEYTPEELVAMTREVKIINKHDGDETVYANAVGTLDSKKYQDLLTLTYKGCAIAVPAADAVLDINKKFKQFVDKNVVSW